MADSSKDIQLRELKDMINDLKKMIKTLQATVDAANKREEALAQELFQTFINLFATHKAREVEPVGNASFGSEINHLCPSKQCDD